MSFTKEELLELKKVLTATSSFTNTARKARLGFIHKINDELAKLRIAEMSEQDAINECVLRVLNDISANLSVLTHEKMLTDLGFSAKVADRAVTIAYVAFDKIRDNAVMNTVAQGTPVKIPTPSMPPADRPDTGDNGKRDRLNSLCDVLSYDGNKKCVLPKNHLSNLHIAIDGSTWSRRSGF